MGEGGDGVEGGGRAVADYQHFTQMALDFWKLFREELMGSDICCIGSKYLFL